MNYYPQQFLPILNDNTIYQLLKEIKDNKQRIFELEKRITKLELEKNNNYLKKDDNYYII